MTTKIKIALHQLDLDMVNDLQEKYPNAEVVLDIQPDRHASVMNESEFWQLIALIDWEKERNEEQLMPLVTALSEMSITRIYAFDDKLSECLFQLDQKAFALHIGEESWSEEQYFSTDNFLYARAAVIANGASFFEQVAENPQLMPDEVTYEPLLYVAASAYEAKTNKEYGYIAAYPIETYSNRGGWKKVG